MPAVLFQVTQYQGKGQTRDQRRDKYQQHAPEKTHQFPAAERLKKRPHESKQGRNFVHQRQRQDDASPQQQLGDGYHLPVIIPVL